MTRVVINLFFLMTFFFAYSQKKAVDLDIINNSVRLNSYNISNDGKYVWYLERAEVSGNRLKLCTSIDGTLKAAFDGIDRALFTADSKNLILTSKKGISIIQLPELTERIIRLATHLKVPFSGNGRYIFYKDKLGYTLENLQTKNRRVSSDSSELSFNDQGTAAVLKEDYRLIWIDLVHGKESEIFIGNEILANVKFNSKGTNVAFAVQSADGVSLYEYNSKLRTAVKILDNSSITLDETTKILSDDFKYSDDDQFILFKMVQHPKNMENDADIIANDVNIWNYKDKELQSHQLKYPDENRSFFACLSLITKKVVQLENSKQLLVGMPTRGMAILMNRINNFENYWIGEIPEYKLISLLTGEQKVIGNQLSELKEFIGISKSGKYITWTVKSSGQIYCYSIRSGLVTQFGLQSNQQDNTGLKISGWLKDDVAMICYDNYDVWQIDPEAKIEHISLTGGNGRKNGIQFRPLELLKKYSATNLSDSILLVAMDVSSKYNGYIKVKLSKLNTINMQFLEPCLYGFSDFVFETFVPNPVKSNYTPTYLLPRQSEKSPVNLFITRDFINYTKVSDIRPSEAQKGYKAELINWKGQGGQTHSGIMYIPEDLDTLRQYPLIFNYYEKKSYERYQYKVPALNSTNINIPWYTSRDYAVFIPDIPTTRGETGLVALETIESAINYLTGKYKWIDKRKIGAQGHSHGGYLTNYIATHSTLFAAAQSSAGYTDFVSGYGQLGFGNISLQFMHEVGQNNLGTTPYKNSEIYIQNSCIFSSDSMVTPLLIMHNQGDGAVPFAQAIELFTSLRRVKKPVWLIEYDNGDHGLSDRKNILDFCTRQQQFFDHYLKGAPAPLWMVEGIPAKYKGIKSGLQLDSLNRTP